MFYVFNLDTSDHYWFLDDVPRKQALKTVFALQNGLASALATKFGQTMDTLENDIVETEHIYSLENYTVLKV